jgi:hypothetical protein
MSQEIRKLDKDLATQFDQAMEHRLKAMDAMSKYAESLVEVVEAGNHGAEAAQKVMASAKTLIDDVGAAFPGGSTVASALSQGAVKVYAAYSKQRAAQSVAKAIAEADPAVQEVAKALAADFATLEKIQVDLRNDELLALLQKTQAQGPAFPYLNTLLLKLKTAPADPPDQMRSLQDQIEAQRKQSWYIDYKASEKEINDRYDRYHALLQQAGTVTAAWGQSHSVLIDASKNNRTPAFRVLIELTHELTAVYRETRKK